MPKPICVTAHPLDVSQAPASPEHRRWYATALRLGRGARGAWLVVAVALVLSLPSLGLGLVADDHVVRSKELTADWSSIFTAFGLEPRPGLDRSTGYLAWWSSPQLHLLFFRPLSTLSHLDLLLFPHAVWVMHAVNILLYAALVALSWRAYRALLPDAPGVAAVAALLFAVDGGHAGAVGWISSRNTLLSALFVLAALLLHVRARALASGKLRLASALCSALALLAGEGGIAIFAYLLAYELAFEQGRLRERVQRLGPQLGVLGAWLAIYMAGGYGARNSSFYRDLCEPLSVLGKGLCDLPLWLLSLLGPSIVSLQLELPYASTRLIATLLCAMLCGVLGLALPRTRETRFFALGALLCLPPLFTTLVQDRVLLSASFGALGVIASFIAAARQSARLAVRAGRWTMIAIHAVIAPCLFVALLGQNAPTDGAAQAMVDALPARAPAQVIYVNLPIELLTLYAYYQVREDPKRTPPELMQQLYAGASELVATRIDSHTLELAAAHGWGARPVERIFGRVSDMPRPGEVLRLDRLEVRVQQSDPEGRPLRVQFRFPTPLESPERAWYAWDGTQPRPWKPPAAGQRATLAPLGLLSSLPR